MDPLLLAARRRLQGAGPRRTGSMVALVDASRRVTMMTEEFDDTAFSSGESVGSSVEEVVGDDGLNEAIEAALAGDTRSLVAIGPRTGRRYLTVLEPLRVADEWGVLAWCYRADVPSASADAGFDSLTGLHDRGGLVRRIEEATDAGTPFVLAVVSLTGFKRINDTCGHGIGDEFLRHIGSRLSEFGAYCARIGSDEFALLLTGDERGSMERILGAALRVVERVGAVNYAGQSLAVSGCGGLVYSDGTLSASDALIEADLAVAEAADAGGGYAVEGRDGHSRASWLTRVHAALLDDGFRLFAQPIVDLRSDRVASYEALVRMLGHDGTPIAPGLFLPIAERFGLIHRIDQWVVERVIETLADRPELHMSVNLSGASINRHELLDAIEARLEHTSLQDGQLTIEITETAMVADIEQARRLSDVLHTHGCRLALDDFGTGFASLYYLKHLRFDYLKVDGEFVVGAIDCPTNRFVIDLALRIAERFDCYAVAEFVEDAATADYLRSVGVPYAQGYHFAKPRPLDELLGA